MINFQIIQIFSTTKKNYFFLLYLKINNYIRSLNVKLKKMKFLKYIKLAVKNVFNIESIVIGSYIGVKTFKYFIISLFNRAKFFIDNKGFSNFALYFNNNHRLTIQKFYILYVRYLGKT